MFQLDVKKVVQNAAKEMERRSERERQIKKKFFATEDGQELLELWRSNLIDLPSDTLGTDLYHLGKAEGRKEVYRGFIHFQKHASEGLV